VAVAVAGGRWPVAVVVAVVVGDGYIVNIHSY
jgi:hypothetical protein